MAFRSDMPHGDLKDLDGQTTGTEMKDTILGGNPS